MAEELRDFMGRTPKERARELIQDIGPEGATGYAQDQAEAFPEKGEWWDAVIGAIEELADEEDDNG